MKRPDANTPDKGSAVSDEQLLLRYTQGNSEAFEQLVRRYRRTLYSFLARFTGDPALAEDVFQETFLQVHLSAGGFDVSRRLKPWLFTIAANKARDALRSRFRHPAAELDAKYSNCPRTFGLCWFWVISMTFRTSRSRRSWRCRWAP